MEDYSAKSKVNQSLNTSKVSIFDGQDGMVMKKLRNCLRVLMMIMGLFFILMIILAFTTAPFWIRYNMGVKKSGIHRPPEYIIFLGGGGMPSESALMRCWYTARVANYYTHAKVIIAQPGDIHDTLNSLYQIKDELVLRGIPPQRILFEDKGTNTRAQAKNIQLRMRNEGSGMKKQWSMVNGQRSMVNGQWSILIVTSPDHLYRSMLTFQKAGFRKVDGIPAFEKDVESDLSFNAQKLGGRRFIPDVGKNITLRYKFWTHLEYEIQIIREYFALGYYKLMGWI